MGRGGVVGGVFAAAAVAGILAFFANQNLVPTEPTYSGRDAVVDLPGYSSNGTLEHPSSADIAQVRADLEAQAAAVMSGDRSAFLGAVDSDRSAFAAAQRTVWSNTQQLPFETFSYRYDGVVESDHPLHTPSFLVHVTTTYQLRGFDTSPIELDDGFTFVRQDGVWKLAGVSDADRRFNSDALPAPWEGHAIETYGDKAYLAVVDRGQTRLARRLVALCHQAARASGRLLGVTNDTPTVVLATTHARGFKKFTGPDAAAAVYPLTTADGHFSGWRMVLNPGYVVQVLYNPIVLTHELTHLATQVYLPYLPRWLSEGAAEYVAWHAHGGLAAAKAARGPVPRRLPARLPISSIYSLEHIQLNYLEGHALVSYLVQRYGTASLVELFRAYASAGAGAGSFDPDTATPGLLRGVLGITTRQLTRGAYAEIAAAGS